MRYPGFNNFSAGLFGLALAAIAAAPLVQADTGLGQDLGRLQQRMQQDSANIDAKVQAAMAGWESSLGKDRSGLAGSLTQDLDGLGASIKQAGGSYVVPTPGTTSFSIDFTYQGLARHTIVIRPEPATQHAPALILMHAHGVSAATMANLSRAGRLAVEYGVWVFLPQGEFSKWNDNPASPNVVDDVGFISRLIDLAVRQYDIDATRVYAAGYSGGGFMAQRLGCELSDKVAGFVAVSAALRTSLAKICRPARAVPAAFMNGTSDAVVPYQGEPGVESASASAAFWAAINGCAAGVLQTAALPNKVNDGTAVALTQYYACPQDAATLIYTIDRGGHTWPGSPDGTYTSDLGRTTKNLDATEAAWQFLTQYSLH